MSKDTRALTEGAVLAALTVLIATIYLYLPLPLLVAVPVPLLVLTYRHGMHTAIGVAFAAALLAGIVSHLVQGVILVLSMGALGLTIGEGLRQNFKPVRIVAFGTVVMLIVTVATFFLTLWITGINSLETMVDSFTESFSMVQNFYQKMGGQSPGVVPSPEEYGKLLRMIFPAGMLLSSAVMSYLAYWLGGLVLAKLGSPVPSFPPFRDWIFPKWVSYALLLLMLGGPLVAQASPVLEAVFTNLLFVGFFALSVEGLALAWSVIDIKLQAGTGVKVLILVVVFFIASPFLAWLGFADNLVDFRHLRRGTDEGHFKG